MEEDKVGREFTFHQLPKSRKVIKKMELKSNVIPASVKCPKCGFKEIVTGKKKDFKIFEKDEEGYLYFECPKCKSHLKYNGLIGEITIVKSKKENNLLGRYQVLLEDWLAGHLKEISEKYDISFSEAIRVVLCLQIPKLVKVSYPNCKIISPDKDMVKVIKAARRSKMDAEAMHRLISKVYFEAHKTIEFWTEEEKKRAAEAN